jgi:crossover junction endodeoxyribonuclease RusA
MKITLLLPPKALSPNARAHWALVARKTAVYRALACMAARCALPGAPPRWTRAELKITWYCRNSRRQCQPDRDNLLAWLKPGIDGLQDAGVVENDRCLKPLPAVILVDAINPRVEITVEPF